MWMIDAGWGGQSVSVPTIDRQCLREWWARCALPTLRFPRCDSALRRRHKTPQRDHRHQERDQHIVAGEREAEKTPLHLVAADHLYSVEALQQIAGAAEIEDRAGAIGRPLPELPFDAGVIAAEIGVAEGRDQENHKRR